MNAHHKKRSFRPSPPSHNSFFSSGSSQNSLDNTRIWKAAERVPFGWQFDAVLPSLGMETSLPVELEELVQKSASFYYCPGMALADLFVPGFMQDYFRKGSLIGISMSEEREAETVCIDGRGRMILSVSKDSYETLGLTGRKSMHGSLGHRFIIELQLSSPTFKCGKPEVERVKAAFGRWEERPELFSDGPLTGLPESKRQTRKFDMLFAFVDDKGQPASIDFPDGISSHLRHPTLTRHRLPSFSIPSLSALFNAPPTEPASKKTRVPDQLNSAEVWDDQQASLREWIGLALIRADATLALESEEEIPSQKGDVEVLSWNGLFHPKILQRIVSHSQCHKPFTAFSLTPHPNSPISHLTSNPTLATTKRPNGKKRKRGRGQGEEDERDPEEAENGWLAVIQPREEGLDWAVWEGQ